MRFILTVEDLGQSVAVEAGGIALSAMLAQGVRFAYQCRTGDCGRCKCELVSGDIAELPYSEGALSPQERARNIILACRSQVWSDVVVRRFDPAGRQWLGQPGT